MKTSKIVIIIFLSLFTLLLLFGWYIGFFNEIKVEEKGTGGYKVAGMDVKGPYAQSGKHMKEIDEQLKAAGFICHKGFGIYYDNPAVVDPKDCRSFIGNILVGNDVNRNSELQRLGFRVDSIPFGNAVVVEFPLKNMLSYVVGPKKVYPVMSNFMQSKGYQSKLSMEIYDVPERKIIFIMQY